MNILITPFICNPNSDSSYFITQSIATFFYSQGHNIAISCDKRNNFKHASLYECAPIKNNIRLISKSQSTYEEYMYYNHGTKSKYLDNDYHHLLDVIDHFKPDIVITLDRIASIMATRMTNTRCWAIVHSDMYKTNTFPLKTMKEVNQTLYKNQFEQEFNLHSIYDYCEKRLGFGSINTQPFDKEYNVTRIGSYTINNAIIQKENKLCVYLSNTNKSSKYLKNLIIETFQGSKYEVYVYIKGIDTQTIDNLHFMKYPKSELIRSCKCLIHDGNNYFDNISQANLVPQIIITNHDYPRNYNALSIVRNGIGKYIYEEDLNVGSLYETFRNVITNDRYLSQLKLNLKNTEKYEDLNKLNTLI